MAKYRQTPEGKAALREASRMNNNTNQELPVPEPLPFDEYGYELCIGKKINEILAYLRHKEQ